MRRASPRALGGQPVIGDSILGLAKRSVHHSESKRTAVRTDARVLQHKFVAVSPR